MKIIKHLIKIFMGKDSKDTSFKKTPLYEKFKDSKEEQIAEPSRRPVFHICLTGLSDLYRRNRFGDPPGAEHDIPYARQRQYVTETLQKVLSQIDFSTNDLKIINYESPDLQQDTDFHSFVKGLVAESLANTGKTKPHISFEARGFLTNPSDIPPEALTTHDGRAQGLILNYAGNEMTRQQDIKWLTDDPRFMNMGYYHDDTIHSLMLKHLNLHPQFSTFLYNYAPERHGFHTILKPEECFVERETSKVTSPRRNPS